MIETSNPFSDPEFRKEILKKDKGEDYEILDTIISDAPQIPSKVKNVILDASELVRNEKEAKAQEMSLALSDIFTKYNKEYGTNLQIDFSSLSRTLINVSDPESRHTLELYLSEVFQSIRPILILHMLSKLTLAIDYILSPDRMFGSEMTIQDTFIAVEKILQFIQQLEDMKDEIIVKGSDLELKRIAEESGNEELNTPEAKKNIEDFMALFMKDNGIKN